MSIPRTLDELLRDFNDGKDVDIDKLESVIDNHVWARRFKDYLLKRDLNDDVTTLQFLILTQPLQVARLLLKRGNHSKDEERHLRDRFLRAGELFFSESEGDGEGQLYLSNFQLFEEVRASVDRLKKHPEKVVQERDLKVMCMAREDMNVIQNGLEPKYVKFILQQSSSPIACLLSIL